MTDEEIMDLGAQKALETSNKGLGGPFGAVITKGDEVIAVESNSVLSTNDPTAHAEINAIRSACKALGTYDLTDCTIYATGYPCPMCMSAVIWSNIKQIYVSGTTEDAEAIGFRDEPMYRFYRGESDGNLVNITQLSRKPAQDLYANYASHHNVIY